MKRRLLGLTVLLALGACTSPSSDAPATAATAAPSPESSPAATAPVENPVAPMPAPGDFKQSLELQGIGFAVHADSNRLTITPSGLEASNEPVTRDFEGRITGAEVADLNADGSPEIYVYARSGEDDHGDLIAYAANKRKSLSEIHLPPLVDDATNGKGYGGRDEFEVVENYLVRRFPIIDEDGQPTGKTRQLQYRLKPGEAGWQLEPGRATEY